MPRRRRDDVRMLCDVQLGRRVTIRPFVNLYGCRLGDEVMIGPFVEIQSGVTVGARSRIQSHSFVGSGVTIGSDVLVGHGVIFANDIECQAARSGTRSTRSDEEPPETTVGDGARIGSGAVITAGVTIGPDATIGAGAVVTRDVEPGAVVAGIPARTMQRFDDARQTA